jgi:hypothetical protein
MVSAEGSFWFIDGSFLPCPHMVEREKWAPLGPFHTDTNPIHVVSSHTTSSLPKESTYYTMSFGLGFQHMIFRRTDVQIIVTPFSFGQNIKMRTGEEIQMHLLWATVKFKDVFMTLQHMSYSRGDAEPKMKTVWEQNQTANQQEQAWASTLMTDQWCCYSNLKMESTAVASGSPGPPSAMLWDLSGPSPLLPFCFRLALPPSQMFPQRLGFPGSPKVPWYHAFPPRN